MPSEKPIPSFHEISSRFHLPLQKAAKELGVCDTMLKRYCRRYGIKKWPFRKFRKTCKLLKNLEKCGLEGDVFGFEHLKNQIESEFKELIELYGNDHFVSEKINVTIGAIQSLEDSKVIEDSQKYNLTQTKLPSFQEFCRGVEALGGRL